MKLKYLLILGLLAIGCKNGEALSPATAHNPPASVATGEPTLGQCAESGWDWSKEKGSEAYAAGREAYQEWRAKHPDLKGEASEAYEAGMKAYHDFMAAHTDEKKSE